MPRSDSRKLDMFEPFLLTQQPFLPFVGAVTHAPWYRIPWVSTLVTQTCTLVRTQDDSADFQSGVPESHCESRTCIILAAAAGRLTFGTLPYFPAFGVVELTSLVVDMF